VYGSILRYEGQVAVFNYNSRINYRVLFPEPPQHIPNCAEAGVLGALCGIVGSIQANEVIKLITGIGETLDGKLWRYIASDNAVQVFRLKKDNSVQPIESLIDYDLFCQASNDMINEISAQDLQNMLDNQEDIQLIDVREPWEKEQDDIWAGLLIPLDEIETNADNIAKDKKVVLYCKTGARSRQALLKLQKIGFTNLYNLVG
jgi:rhodanese-related sulfurtransferase